MAQFVIFFAHAMQPLFIECDYPKVTMMMMMVMMMMVVMMVVMMVMMINNNDFNLIEVGCTWCNQLHSPLLRWILVLLNGI